ncbi:MAG: hypothetical protein LJE84_04040 [Gammaproteobacteria bacterium]|nr:hypothetical protein [Gammaproteobacteria bacterium]
MIVLGLHFGHDGSVSVLEDGVLRCHVLRERTSRTKHAVGITGDDIQQALAAAGVSVRDVDLCALTSTQDMEMLTGLIPGCEIRFADPAHHPLPSPFAHLLDQAGVDLNRALAHGLRDLFNEQTRTLEGLHRDRFRRLLPEWRQFAAGTIASHGWMNQYMTHDHWQRQRGLEEIVADGIDPASFDDPVRLGMHLPVQLRLGDREIPGLVVDHHVCHGASSFYRSDFERAAVLTHDGGDARRNLSGYFLYGEGSHLYTLAPHHLVMGGVYRSVGVETGFDVVGAEGKLMGLAPYGEPVFFEEALAGNGYDMLRALGDAPFAGWMAHCRGQADETGFNDVLEAFPRDLAASTQRLFEACYRKATDALQRLLARAGRPVDALCLSGGCALNCPSNTQLANTGIFQRLFVEPNCDDGGLSVGAALYLWHNVLGRPRQAAGRGVNQSPYLGIPLEPAEVQAACDDARASGMAVEPAGGADARGPGERLAADLEADRVVAWVEGRSEMGPRALGHRSLLANPGPLDNWRRVNAIKGREAWRPLAPAVLASRAADFFSGCPLPSPYMLFTAQVRGDALAAIKHVDGSARIQTVDAGSGQLASALQTLDTRTGVPVVVNTSLNGPGEPIVERPAEALAFFREHPVDVLYIDGHRISREA